MNNYYELEYNKEYNSKDLSSKISCQNMSKLSKKYILIMRVCIKKDFFITDSNCSDYMKMRGLSLTLELYSYQ